GEAERDRVDPALERHVEGVDRVFAHAASQQVVGLGLALLTERAQQAAVDEPLMRLVRRDLRLDVPILRRGSLVDPGMVLLDGRELGGGDRREELQDDPAVLLGHLLDGLDLAHPEKDAPLDSARDRHGDDLLRREASGAARVYMGRAVRSDDQPRSRASTSSGIARAWSGSPGDFGRPTLARTSKPCEHSSGPTARSYSISN